MVVDLVVVVLKISNDSSIEITLSSSAVEDLKDDDYPMKEENGVSIQMVMLQHLLFSIKNDDDDDDILN